MSIDQELYYDGKTVLDIISADGKPRKIPNVWITEGARGTEGSEGAIFVADIYVYCDQRDSYGIVEFHNPTIPGMENHTIRVDEPFKLQVKFGEQEIPGTLTWTHTPELGTTTRSRR